VTAAAHAADAYSGAADPCPVLHAADTAAATEAVFNELRPQFEGHLPAGMVRDYVDRAAADLAGSISREALPEMVIRLAAVRLERQLWPDGEPQHARPTWFPPAVDSVHRSDPAGRPFTLLMTPHHGARSE